MRNVSDKIVEKMKTHFIFHKRVSEIQAFYEIMCKNMAQPVRPQTAITRRMLSAC
jgi:hypothetical protein